MLNKLYQLKKPKTNISIIQQNVLLKYKYFVRFLKEHGEDIYQEVRSKQGMYSDNTVLHMPVCNCQSGCTFPCSCGKVFVCLMGISN